MELHKITDDLTVSGQIDPDEIPLLAAQGIRAIICNRPDGEAEGQPPFDAIEQAASAAGMKVAHIPVSGPIADADAAAFGKALAELPKPILAYCRSGTRSIMLWSLSEAGKSPPEEILLKAARAGYDLSALAPRLQSRQHP